MDELEQLMEQGNADLKQGKLQQAFLYFNKVALLTPAHLAARVACATTLLELNRPAEAALYSEHALKLSPSCATLTLHAKALYQMGKYQAALNCFERILLAEPQNYVTMAQLALCLTQVNRYDEALELYQQALHNVAQQDAWLSYNYSLCLLAMENLPLGFQFFEYRWWSVLSDKRRASTLPASVNQEVLQGKSILIYSEQGLGDSIQFFRYIPLLVSLGARVFLEMQPGLIPLFYSWHNTIHFIATGAALPLCDYQCSMMSLAGLFKTEISTIPKSIPYLFADLHTVEICQQKLGYSTRKRLGIAWKGSTFNTMNQKRSINLDMLLTLHQPNLDFICLQRDVSFAEKKQLDQYQIAYPSLELHTMAGTAALIACLDLIITVDTSIAHLAAAMGKEVWILLPFSADWRWFLQRTESPWYPTVKLFRQTALEDWSVPLAQLKNALCAFSLIECQSNLEDLMQQANVQLQQGLLARAEQLYRLILIKYPACHRAAEGVALAAFLQNKMADAIQFMQQASEIAPQIVLYRRNLGELLCRVGQFEAAILSHRIAISKEPDLAENHFLLALAYNNSRQFDLAIEHYRIALTHDPNYGLAWNNLGASLESSGDKHHAKAAYTTAIRLNPNHAEALNNLGAIYSEEGLIEEARSHFAAAIAAKPDFIEAHYNLSLIKTYQVNDPHLVFLETLAQSITTCSTQVRINYYFALGKALDDTQQYARAFQAYVEGNRLHSLQKPWNNTKLVDLVKQTPNIFTLSFLTCPKATKETRCPIFIIGMPRAGTTLIEQILSSHENIYGAGELSILDEVIQQACQKAGMPFNTWVTQLTDNDFILLGKKYLDLTWELAKDKDFIVDKMPSNCFYIGMIYRMLPTAKIIHAMRDPMDSCFSCFTHLFKQSMLFAYDLQTLGHYYLLYAEVMQHWRDVLPTGTLFEVSYEQMVAEHEKLSKRLLAYIGLPWDPNCLNFYKNERVVKTASLMQVRKPIYKTSIARWKYFAEQLQPLLQLVAPQEIIHG
jgi:tetratricopeptide (TPR) repeat protein